MSSQRIDKLNDYLVGGGCWSKIPPADAWFYNLAGDCSHERWPVKPSEWKPDRNGVEESADCGITLTHNCSADGRDSDKILLFRPKPHLPAPLYRQTYRIWKSTMDMNLQFRRIRKCKTIFIQPLDEFPRFIWDFVFNGGSETGFFTLLQKFLAIFFMDANVELLPGKSTENWKITRRKHKLTGKDQLLVDDVNHGLSTVMPSGGLAILGLTWTDLYPSADLNFVLGEASVECKSAALCFGRFEPKVYESGSTCPPITAVNGDLIYKMIKVVAHELCHVFYLSHCVFYECLMNESTSVAEAMDQPLFLCPVCMRKMQKVCKFDIVKRYNAMLEFLLTVHNEFPSEYLKKSTEWLQQVLQWSAQNVEK